MNKTISMSIRVSEEELAKLKQAARIEAYASYSQMRWVVLEKGDMRDAYVSEIQFENLKGISYMINNTFEQFADGCIVISEDPSK